MVKFDPTKVFVTNQAYIGVMENNQVKQITPIVSLYPHIGFNPEDAPEMVELPRPGAASITLGIMDTSWLPIVQPPQFQMTIMPKGLMTRWVMRNRVRRPRSIRAIRVVGWQGEVQINTLPKPASKILIQSEYSIEYPHHDNRLTLQAYDEEGKQVNVIHIEQSGWSRIQQYLDSLDLSKFSIAFSYETIYGRHFPVIELRRIDR